MRVLLVVLFVMSSAYTQTPTIEPGVSHELAKWRAARYSDVRYKLNLTLEKMSPVLRGTIEVRVKISEQSVPPASAGSTAPIVLDWRKIKGHEDKSTISNVSINGHVLNAVEESNEHLIFRDGVVAGENVIKLDFTSPILTSGSAITRYIDKEDGAEYIYSLFVPSDASTAFPVFDQPDLKGRFNLAVDTPGDWVVVSNGHGVASPPKMLNFFGYDFKEKGYVFVETEPISTYVFAFAAGPWQQVSVPPAVAGGSDAAEKNPPATAGGTDSGSRVDVANPGGGNPTGRKGVSASTMSVPPNAAGGPADSKPRNVKRELKEAYKQWQNFDVSIPMTKDEAHAFRNPPATAGGTDSGSHVGSANPAGGNPTGREGVLPQRDGDSVRSRDTDTLPTGRVSASTDQLSTSIYVRKSQLAKFQPHAAEVFRLNREGVKFLEQYFDYKFPFPKYDIVLIPEFPFGGMEHAGATFLRESAVIFPQEPTKNDYISRANVIFHEAAHQWFGDTVTMKWFDDLWLKEGFAEFMAYKTLEKVMPEYNAWKVFYERNKQAAYLTDSTKGTTPIYQEIKNLNSAKSAYGNIVYRKAPSFLKQAEFYIGPDVFQTAVRRFLKKHEFENAGWEDLVREFEGASGKLLNKWAKEWVTQRGLPVFRAKQVKSGNQIELLIEPKDILNEGRVWRSRTLGVLRDLEIPDLEMEFEATDKVMLAWSKKLEFSHGETDYQYLFPNYQDYGYGIFLLDDKSRDYILKNIQNEKDDFLRSMMWGSLWDSVREAELDPNEYVELVIRNLSTTLSAGAAATPPKTGGESDESTIATLLGRVSTAMTYYRSEPRAVATGSPRAVEATKGNPVATASDSDLSTRLEALLIEKMRTAPTLGQRITYYRALLNIAFTANARNVLKEMLRQQSVPPAVAGGSPRANAEGGTPNAESNPRSPIHKRQSPTIPLKTKDRFDIVTRLLILKDPDAPKLLAGLEKTETSDEAKRYAYAAKAGIATAENKAKFWNDFTANKEISESWIEAAFAPFNSVRHADLTLPYLERALKELPNHKRNRKIFFINGWLGAFIGGQRSEEALGIVNKFLADNPNLGRDLRLKILENVDLIERAVKIRGKFATR